MKNVHGIIQMVCLRQHIVLCKSNGQKQIFVPMFDTCTCTCSGFSKKKVVILFECHVTTSWYSHWPQIKIVDIYFKSSLYLYINTNVISKSSSLFFKLDLFNSGVYDICLSTWIENDKWKMICARIRLIRNIGQNLENLV